MHYYEYVEMFNTGMERLTGHFRPEYYATLFTYKALDACDTKRLLNVLSDSEYDAMCVLELKEYLSDYSTGDVKDYARMFIQSIDLMENLNTFCAENDVPEIARAYIIDKIIVAVDEIKDIL